MNSLELWCGRPPRECSWWRRAAALQASRKTAAWGLDAVAGEHRTGPRKQNGPMSQCPRISRPSKACRAALGGRHRICCRGRWTQGCVRCVPTCFLGSAVGSPPFPAVRAHTPSFLVLQATVVHRSQPFARCHVLVPASPRVTPPDHCFVHDARAHTSFATRLSPSATGARNSRASRWCVLRLRPLWPPSYFFPGFIPDVLGVPVSYSYPEFICAASSDPLPFPPALAWSVLPLGQWSTRVALRTASRR